MILRAIKRIRGDGATYMPGELLPADKMVKEEIERLVRLGAAEIIKTPAQPKAEVAIAEDPPKTTKSAGKKRGRKTKKIKAPVAPVVPTGVSDDLKPAE